MDVHFPGVHSCCSHGTPLTQGGRKLITLQALIGIYRESSMLMVNKEIQDRERIRSRCLIPREADTAFTGRDVSEGTTQGVLYRQASREERGG